MWLHPADTNNEATAAVRATASLADPERMLTSSFDSA